MAGAKPSFTKTDVLLVFMHLVDRSSRQALAQEVGVGEGAIRSILDILKNKGFIESSPHGHQLTQKGEGVLGDLSAVIKAFCPIDTLFYKDYQQFAIVVGKGAIAGIEARDEAIRNGAKAALVLVHDGHLKAPSFEMDFSSIESEFDLVDGDVVIVTYADDLLIAKRSAAAVALYVSENLRELVESISGEI